MIEQETIFRSCQSNEDLSVREIPEQLGNCKPGIFHYSGIFESQGIYPNESGLYLDIGYGAMPSSFRYISIAIIYLI